MPPVQAIELGWKKHCAPTWQGGSENMDSIDRFVALLDMEINIELHCHLRAPFRLRHDADTTRYCPLLFIAGRAMHHTRMRNTRGMAGISACGRTAVRTASPPGGLTEARENDLLHLSNDGDGTPLKMLSGAFVAYNHAAAGLWRILPEQHRLTALFADAGLARVPARIPAAPLHPLHHRKAGRNRLYVARDLCAQISDCGVQTFIRALKMSATAKMLRDSNLTVARVAEETGYQSKAASTMPSRRNSGSPCRLPAARKHCGIKKPHCDGVSFMRDKTGLSEQCAEKFRAILDNTGIFTSLSCLGLNGEYAAYFANNSTNGFAVL